MTSCKKVISYIDHLDKLPEYGSLPLTVQQLSKDQSIFSQLVPKNLANHCTMGRILNGKLTIQVRNGAIAAKLKQTSPTLIRKMQALGWKVTAIHILVQAPHAEQALKSFIVQNNIGVRKLSQAGKDSLRHLTTTLQNSELKDTIQRFLAKHSND